MAPVHHAARSGAAPRAAISISAMPCSTPKLIQLRGNISAEPSDTSTAQPATAAHRRQNMGRGHQADASHDRRAHGAREAKSDDLSAQLHGDQCRMGSWAKSPAAWDRAYRAIKRVSLDAEVSYEIADTVGPTRKESATRMFYYLGGRFDF